MRVGRWIGYLFNVSSIIGSSLGHSKAVDEDEARKIVFSLYAIAAGFCSWYAYMMIVIYSLALASYQMLHQYWGG